MDDTVGDGTDFCLAGLSFGGGGLGVGGILEGGEVVSGVFNPGHRVSLKILPRQSFHPGKDLVIRKVRD